MTAGGSSIHLFGSPEKQEDVAVEARSPTAATEHQPGPVRSAGRSSASEAKVRELRTAFDMFDKDGSGSIDMGELRQVLRVMGQFPTDVELAELMERMDSNQNGVVEFEEFRDALLGQAADEEMERELREVAEVFALFDTDGSGLLSADELQRALRILGVSMSRGEVELLMSEIDENGDGEISCEELLQYVLNFDPEAADAADAAGDAERGGAK